MTVATGSDQVITMLEQNLTKEYSNYFGTDFKEQFLNEKTPREILTDMAAQTGKESAVVADNSARIDRIIHNHWLSFINASPISV